MVKNLLLVLALGAGLACLVPTRAQSSAPPPPAAVPETARAFREEVIGELSAGSSFKSIAISGDHIAWVEDSSGKRTVRLDGVLQGGTYDDVEKARFSPGAAHFLFFGKHSSSWILVLDGREQPELYDKVSWVSFQPEGDSYAFLACQAKECQLNVAGTKRPSAYDDFSYLQYSQDGKRLAYLGKRSGKWVAVVDGKEQEPSLDDVRGRAWGFTENGSRFYVTGRVNGKWTYIVDGQPGPGFDVVSPIAFSPDGQHYAYGGTIVKGGALKKKTIGTMVVDGKPGETYEGKGMAGSLSLIGGAWEYMLGGVHYLGADFHGVSTPRFSPTGMLAYAVRQENGGIALRVGDQKGPPFENIISPVAFSLDSTQLVYIAGLSGRFQEVRNHQVVRNFSLSKTKGRVIDVPWVQMSSDGTHLAYEIVSGGQDFGAGGNERALRAVVMDGKTGPEYNALGIESYDLSSDPKHYYYEVRGARGNNDLVNVDGLESDLYDAVWALHFADKGKAVIFVARRDRQILRVTLRLE